MIPRSKVQDVEDHLGGGENQAFTIAVTGKAFHVLIDGLYSNKIQSIIRELWSNARDSHVEAGKPDVPFECDLPTNLAPVFRVRDYGVGLAHDDVMHLYTTMFGSSKTDSNQAVGMLGLGSKSPFAYTDSFSVVAYDGKQKRTYIAFIQTDGVPNIRHVSTDPSDEPTGLEVSFAVKIQDYRDFAKEAQVVGYGFDVQPICNGVQLKAYKDFLRLGNIRIVESSETNNWYPEIKIKQGCVLYPIENVELRNMFRHGKIVIIEVPIGSVDVTASREALSMDEETKRCVAKVVSDAKKTLEDHIESELNAEVGQYNRVVKANELSEWCNLVPTEAMLHQFLPQNMRTSTRVKPGIRRSRLQREQFCIWRYSSRKDWQFIPSVDHYTAQRIRILVDDKEKVERKASRMRDYSRDNPYMYVISGKFGDVEKQKARLKRLLNIDEDNFIRVVDLPDNRPPKIARAKKEGLLPGEYWLLKSRNKIALPAIHKDNYYRGYDETPAWKLRLFREVGLPSPYQNDPNVKTYTEKEAIRMGLDESRRLDVVCAEKLKSHHFNFEGYALCQALKGRAHETATKLIWDKYFPNIPKVNAGNYDEQNLIRHYGEWTGQLSAVCAKMESEVKKIERKLPLLFGGSGNEQAIMEYIKLKEAKP